MHSLCQICAPAPATWKNWCLRVLTERKWLAPLPVRGYSPYTSLCSFYVLIYFHFSLYSIVYRYLRPLVADVAVVAKCHLSALYRHEKGKLFAQLVDLLQFYERFEINDYLAPSCSQTPVIYSERRVRRKSLSPGRMPRAIAEYVSCDLTSYHLMMFLLHRVALKLLMLH
ncbi:hypothetical protein DKX38_017811 [Salix brachista]|uniref:RNA helicase aquarius N-terminal domain-containing protein n=1 Tax=Salix brachista TaxID=2182728 RepID=A0A5N5KW75_9ROSI|nr:hypothetical protein DKX38_017811 [Salix brachista]